MSEPGVGRFLVAFSVQGVVFIILLFVIELQCIHTLWRLFTSLFRRSKKVDELRGCLKRLKYFFMVNLQTFLLLVWSILCCI